jgi:Mg-chelatase subunit ChlD
MYSGTITGQSDKPLRSFALSCCIHAVILLALCNPDWAFLRSRGETEAPTISIIARKQNENQFLFQPSIAPQALDEFRVKGTDAFDELKADKMQDNPLPKLETYAAVPDVKFTPDIQVREDANLAGAPTLDRSLLAGPKGAANSIGEQGLPFYGAGEKFSGSFARDIQGARKMGLDVVFIIDATSSMAEFLRQVKIKIANLVMSFKTLVPTTRIGLVAYRDRGDDFVTKTYPLTHKTQQLQQFLQGIEPVGGGDREEAMDEGVRVAVNELKWDKGSKKIILIIGDAPPHKQDMQKTLDLITKFRTQMGGMAATLDTSVQRNNLSATTVSLSVLPEFRQLAEAGGGESARMVDEEKVIKQMVVLVFGTKWESYLDEFLKNL